MPTTMKTLREKVGMLGFASSAQCEDFMVELLVMEVMRFGGEACCRFVVALSRTGCGWMLGRLVGLSSI